MIDTSCAPGIFQRDGNQISESKTAGLHAKTDWVVVSEAESCAVVEVEVT